MNTKIYGVLKSNVLVDEGEYTSKRSHLSHYNMITTGNKNLYQVNIDIQSNPSNPNVHMLCIKNYQNRIIQKFNGLDSGFTPLPTESNGLALDYIRQGLFSPEDLFASAPLSGDEISKILDEYVKISENIIVFGTQYGPGHSEKGHYGTVRSLAQDRPDTGIDDIHLNQSSMGTYAKSNGIYQDGALFVQSLDKTYTAFFFSFDEQCDVTDSSGNCIR